MEILRELTVSSLLLREADEILNESMVRRGCGQGELNARLCSNCGPAGRTFAAGVTTAGDGDDDISKKLDLPK